MSQQVLHQIMTIKIIGPEHKPEICSLSLVDLTNYEQTYNNYNIVIFLLPQNIKGISFPLCTCVYQYMELKINVKVMVPVIQSTPIFLVMINFIRFKLLNLNVYIAIYLKLTYTMYIIVLILIARKIYIKKRVNI